MAVIAAFVLNAGLNFALGLLLAKLLGPADFGRFALATAGAIVLNTLLFEWLRLSATLEAGALASYFDARTDRRKQEAVPIGDVSRAPAVLSVEGRTHDVKARTPSFSTHPAGASSGACFRRCRLYTGPYLPP